MYATAKRLVDQTRSGKGPAFLLCNTYRYRGHHVGDVNREYYRAKLEEQRWMAERDPIKLLADWVTGQKLADKAQLDEIQKQVKSEIDTAVDFATKAAYPGMDQLEEDIYA